MKALRRSLRLERLKDRSGNSYVHGEYRPGIPDVAIIIQRREDDSHPLPACPDCGGTGDLRNAIGKFDDSRLQTKADATMPTGNSVANVNIRRSVDAYKQNGRMT